MESLEKYKSKIKPFEDGRLYAKKILQITVMESIQEKQVKWNNHVIALREESENGIKHNPDTCRAR